MAQAGRGLMPGSRAVPRDSPGHTPRKTAAPAKPAADQAPLSHNLLGQRLGRKGRDTRERILAATGRLLAAPDTVISLSGVAREASLGMTSLYLYFSDLTELLIAALEPIMASAEDSYIARLRVRWPDTDLGSHCTAFVRAYEAFWQRHTRILHLRNSIADADDKRMRLHRIEASAPVARLLVLQMDGDSSVYDSNASCMATVLLTGIERLITITTDAQFPYVPLEKPAAHIDNLLQAEARLLEIAIRDCRDRRVAA
jgi:AcrR family transcriptional regulator